MPKEVKNIYFSSIELRKALAKFSSKRNKFFDYSDIDDLTITDKPTINISCKVDEYLEFDDNNISFSEPEIAAALLSFCMDCKIPLPKTATKELHGNSNEVFLVIKLGHELDEEECFDIG